MNIAQTIASLQELRRESGKRISDSVITGMTLSLTRARYQLFRTRLNPSGPGTINAPTGGTSTLLQNIKASRKLMTLTAGAKDNFTFMLNTALLGGTSYPVLNAVLGTVAGVASGGAGLLFTVATTMVDVSRTTQRVLARQGDELWQVEEIGKSRESGFLSGNSMVAVHVGSYWLVDPYRSKSSERNKGWLIHEERHELNL